MRQRKAHRHARPFCLAGLAAALAIAAGAAVEVAQPGGRVLDLTHYSAVLGEERNYRVFLPRDYDQVPEKRYPVIYFFHGWSERHNRPPNTGRGYDAGDDYGGDNIANFVGRHDVIVVKWDGFNPRTSGENYLRPYNIPPETHRQFPFYFPELVEHVDATFRTISDRDHRATAGLSMGGFMSFWVAGKHPQLVGSASSFMGSSEFYAGPLGWPGEYRHTEMHRNYEGLRTRLVTGTRDFIRWYHRRMNAIWDFTRPHHEHEAFDAEHGTPGMGKTLAFHMNAFGDPLPRPALWHHLDLYPDFDVWDYSVQTDRRRPGFTALENVTAAGFRSVVREWLPGGALMPSVSVRVTTSPRYEPGRHYWITDVNLSTGEVGQIRQRADPSGRLRVSIDGHLHEIGVAETPRAIVAPAGWRVVDAPWAVAGAPVRLAITLVNKGAAEARNVRATISSPNPGVVFRPRELRRARLGPGEQVESRELVVTVNDPDREVLKLMIRIETIEYPLEIPLFSSAGDFPELTIADGVQLPVWERALNRTTRLVGTGNGDGAADRGETVALAVRDGEAYRLVELLTSHPCADVTRRVSDSWGSYDNVGASAKWSLLLVSSSCATDGAIPVVLRYQRPSKPEHALVEGSTVLRIRGVDRTAPQAEWAAIRDWNVLEVQVREGGRVRTARAALRQQDGAELLVRLNDEGREGDRTAGDGIFSGLVAGAPAGVYQVMLSAEDEFGNTASTSLDDEVRVAPLEPVR
jgi:S-formylglutathione hydrolase FrmB